ncbi:hypothetical protein BCAR13_1040052 [Paraburkholderia caribensis]|nr:hypothetical protein BCAR13_1040052 [Paraburkholderia caribensis]
MHHCRVARQAVDIQRCDVRVAAADGGALEQLRTDSLAAYAFRHRHAEFSGARVALSGQISQMADADQLQMAVEHAEHGIAAEIQHANVVFDDVVRRDLTEAQQAIVFVEFEEVSEQTLAVFLAEFPDQNRRAASDVQRAIDDDRLGRADSLQIHGGFSFSYAA